MDGFFERLLDRLEEMNLIRADLCRALGISEGTVRNWKKGVMPAADTALKIADFLNVSLEYLVTGKKDESKKSKIELSDFEKNLLCEAKDLTQEDKVELMAYIAMKKSLYRTLKGDNGKMAIVKDC